MDNHKQDMRSSSQAGKYHSVNSSPPLPSLYHHCFLIRVRVAPILTLWERLSALPSAPSSQWLFTIVCHSLLIWRNRLGHLLTPWTEVKCPNASLNNAFSLNDGGNRDTLWMSNKWDYNQEFLRRLYFCMIYFASSLKCRITSSVGERAILSCVCFPELSLKRCQGTCQGMLSFTVVPQESSFFVFHHNQDFIFSTYWQLRDRIRCILSHSDKKCRCEETKERRESLCI